MSRPNFEGVYGITSPPLRHVFMAATVWRLAADFPNAPLRILEVGSWCGASALTWAHALAHYGRGDGEMPGELTCVDAWEPYIDTAANADPLSRSMEEALRSDEPLRVFHHNIGCAPPGIAIRVIRARSADALPALPRAQFHLVYIDGDHAYPAVAADIALARALVIGGGVLCGDDLEVQAHQCDLSALEGLPHVDRCYDARTDTYFHPGVTRAVGEAFGPVSAWHGYWAVRRRGSQWDPVSLAGMPVFLPPHLPADSLIDWKLQVLDSVFKDV